MSGMQKRPGESKGQQACGVGGRRRRLSGWICVLLAISICLHPLAVRAEGITDDSIGGKAPDAVTGTDAISADGTLPENNKDQPSGQDGSGQQTGQQTDQTGQGQQPGRDDSGASGGDTGRISTLVIDNQNVYEGMDRPYAEGYVPRVEGGNVLVVIPMRLEGEAVLKNNTLRASLNLGDTGNTPFVYRNYDKSITLSSHPVNNGTGTAESFLASFQLELLPERYNGSYPVTLAVEGTDQAGLAISQNFVVYVTITDGKDPNALPPEPEEEPVPQEPPTFVPKLLVQSYRYIKKEASTQTGDQESKADSTGSEILAGDEIMAEITLINTSKTQTIRNLTVTAGAPGEALTLLSPTDSVYIESVKGGETCVVTFDYRIREDAATGQYGLTLAMDYADSKGAVYTGAGNTRLSVRQPTEVKFDPLLLPEQMDIGDVIQVQVQAMNLGRSKVLNVRAELAADGLKPQGTLFIGDIEAGNMAVGSTQVTVGGMVEGDSPYGETEGTVTFYYEDEAGREQSVEMPFTTTISSPFTGQSSEPEDEPGQWWVIMAVVGVLLCGCVAVLVARKIRKVQI